MAEDLIGKLTERDWRGRSFNRDGVAAAAEIERLTTLVADYEDVVADKRRLAREIDVAMHGEEGAAKQPSLCDLVAPAAQMRATIEKLTREMDAAINAPEIARFVDGVMLEAEHQRQRWGESHDAQKEPQDWFWTLGYLGGKALRAALDGDMDKLRHHQITAAALLANWHRLTSAALSTTGEQYAESAYIPAREALAPGREHLTVSGTFQSDKYLWCPAGFVPLKVTDPMAFGPLRDYAFVREVVDPAFTRDLLQALAVTGGDPDTASPAPPEPTP